MDKASVQQALLAALECLAPYVEKGGEIVLGCSTSEITGGQIGHQSAPEVGEWVAEAMISFCRTHGFASVFQCCEHLNRALVMEKDEALKRGYTRVCAVPQPKAGGSVPAAAWKMLSCPALVMHAQADAGLDVGDTLIGMHLRPVAVPLRGDVRQVGHANLVMAYTRLPFIGGSRAVYTQT